MLARLRGMVQAMKASETEADQPTPGWESPVPPGPTLAASVSETPAEAPDTSESAPAMATVSPEPPAEPLAAPVPPTEPLVVVAPEAPPAPPVSLQCPLCQAPRTLDRSYCESCGYFFPTEPSPVAGPITVGELLSRHWIAGRYELQEQLSERLGVARFRGLDHGTGADGPVPVVIVRMPLPPAEELPAAEVVSAAPVAEGEEILPGFDEPSPPIASVLSTEPEMVPPGWPSVAWEKALLEIAQHPSLPAVLDSFVEDGFAYLVEELPTGRSLWDAWDDPEADGPTRFGLLKQIAECLQRLHQAGVILEGLRPDIVVVTPEGRARLTDLSDLLPVPVPPGAPIRGTLYTAPELTVNGSQADARADLYSFGAMLCALYVGRELVEEDFDRKTRAPKPVAALYPDIHPALARLISKTFCRDVHLRFPTDEAAREDPTGFTELIRTLEVCGRVVDNVRLEVAAWTTTGMVRTGNEDAFALLHAVESRQDDLGECVLVLLADGMGGYEAGEVAAALAIQALRKNLLQQKPFQMLAGGSPFPSL
ncbi:MAG TPA: hypothetical protein VNK04_04850, partial [Gemmataceae bacterium]|nr:hypothetical protein [Gemmataceae bacterium]